MLAYIKNKVREYSKKYRLDLAYVIRSEFWVYLRYGIGIAAGLAVSIVFARLAPKEVFGQYNYVLAILGTVAIASIPGLNTAVIRSTARGYEGNYRQAAKTKLLWSLLGTLALFCIGAYFYYYGTRIVGISLMVSGVFFPLLYSPSIWDGFLVGKKRFDLTAKYGSIQSVVSTVAMIVVLFLGAAHLLLIIIVYLAANSILSFLFYLGSLRYIKNQKKDDECIKYGYFLTGVGIVGTIGTYIDKILIGTLLGAPELAIWTIALTIPNNLKNFLKTFWNPFVPKFSQDEIKMGHISASLKNFLLPLTLLTLAGTVLYMLFIGDVIVIFFSDKYLESIIYAEVLFIMVLVGIPDTLLSTFILAKKETKIIMRVDITSAILGIAIIAGFIYKWGIMGAALGLVARRILHVSLMWLAIRR